MQCMHLSPIRCDEIAKNAFTASKCMLCVITARDRVEKCEWKKGLLKNSVIVTLDRNEIVTYDQANRPINVICHMRFGIPFTFSM